MMTESRSKFQTTDLALAAFLIGEGFTGYELISIQGGRDQDERVAWQFDPAIREYQTADLHDSVAEFKDGEALVEPDAFLKIVTQARRQLFAYLDNNK